MGLEEKRKGRHKIQGIALDIVCDVLFLTGAVASIALLGNPIALAVAAPFITLGCIVMVGNIAKSTYHQVQRFKHHLSQFSREEQEEMRQEMQKEINSSRLYRIMAKVLPDSIVLAKLYDSKANKAERKEIARLERMLKRDSNNSSFSKAASDNIRPLAEPVYDEKFLGEVKMSTIEYSDVFEECRQALTIKLPSEIELCKRSNELNPNHDLPSSQLSLDESAITKKETENTLPSF